MMKLMPFAWPPATEIVVVGKFLFVLRSAGGAEAASPERKISSVTWRPLRGSSVTRWLSITWPTPVLCVSTIVALATTVTVSPCVPTLRVTLTMGFVLTWSTIPLCT
jgi:hypothetical protein